MKHSMKAAVAVMMVATTISTFVDAATTKKKATSNRASYTQSTTNYSCEGTDARITSNALNGNNRNESRFSFGMQVNRGIGTATIMGTRGTNLIRSGRYIMSSSGKGFSLPMNWVDSYNNSQSFQLEFTSDGSFSGSSYESGSNENETYSALCSIIGKEWCSLTDFYVMRKVEGVCWQQ